MPAFDRVTVVPGTPVILHLDCLANIEVVPSSSCSVETTLSHRKYIDAGTAIWTVWPAGTVTSKTRSDLTAKISAARITATDGNVTVEVVV
jgi:6-phosphogluconate dehydrogenase (decarboxylating)